ncbi:adhesion G protein-coupled receptor L1-like isoform X1 [Asterias rubens]|uniref:adhesion G protein-coupled receptor L1-like isoform X1 n=2 Tax=Asterias rubens TaxID=7604 RepID=UPI00145561E8|nr:adhesion G protein-coupled receptor L1-like isoform X1 [Asterias rubens]
MRIYETFTLLSILMVSTPEAINFTPILVTLTTLTEAGGADGSGGSETVSPTTDYNCTLDDVHNCFAPCTMSNVSRANFSEAKLSDSERENLLEILRVLISLDDGETNTLPEITALIRLGLDVFTTLTNDHQSLTIEEETEVVALTEEVLASIAGNLELGNCVKDEVESNSVYICHDTSENIGNKSIFTYEIENGDTEKDYQTENSENFKDRLNFDLQSDNDDISFVVLRTENQKGVEVMNEEEISGVRAPSSTKFIVNSAFLAFSLYVEGIKTSVPVNYTLYHHVEAKDDKISIQGLGAITRQPMCVFWNDTISKWSSKGCWLAHESPTSYSDCISKHSTSFAVILKITSDNEGDEFILEMLTKIGFGASILGLVCTLAIFFYLREMLQFERIFMHTNLAIAILAAQILFLSGIDKTEDEVTCKIIALFLHYFYLSVFGWMLVEGVHLYMKVVKVYGSENIKMYRYVLIGWVAPAIICAISLGANNKGYGTDRCCWLDTDGGMIWAFAAPILVVGLMNTVVLVTVLRIVMKSAQMQNNNNMDHIKCGAKGAMVLLPILGVTWLFGLMNSVNIVFQYLFTGLNSFQGLFIFFIQCVFNSEVKAAFSRKRAQHKLEMEVSNKSQGETTTSRKSNTDTSDRNVDCSEECTEMTQYSRGSSFSTQGASAVATGIHTPKKKRPMSGKVAPMPKTTPTDVEGF